MNLREMGIVVSMPQELFSMLCDGGRPFDVSLLQKILRVLTTSFCRVSYVCIVYIYHNELLFD